MAQRIVLGLDTCTRWLNLALLDDSGRAVASLQEEVPTHTTRLVAAVDDLLRGCGARREDLSALGAVVGPGSFTGLRVGLAAALGLSFSLSLPTYGLDSLTAIALDCGAEGEGVSLLDARRSQVYARRFVKTGPEVRPMSEPEAVSPSEVLAGGWHPAWAAGGGVEFVTGWPPRTRLFPGPSNLALPAARKALLGLKAREPSEELTPLYVRGPDVREPRR
jgi:tRNA threonylcarbamoyladenosine biosynthesis protein TsaB